MDVRERLAERDALRQRLRDKVRGKQQRRAGGDKEETSNALCRAEEMVLNACGNDAAALQMMTTLLKDPIALRKANTSLSAPPSRTEAKVEDEEEDEAPPNQP